MASPIPVMSSVDILFVDHYPGDQLGGGERHLLRVADAAAKAGWRIGVLCTPSSALEVAARERGFAVLARRMTGPVSVRSAVREAARDMSPRLVNFHGFLVTSFGACPARRVGVARVITTVHNMPSAALDLRPGLLGKMEWRLRSALTRRAARCIDVHVCVVDAVRRELEEIGVGGDRLTVIHNGIPDPALSVEVPSTDEVIVGSVGRFELLKGYRYLIQAVARLADQLPGVRFRLVGEGSLGASLREQAASLDLAERLEMPGWSEDSIAEIAAMDVYVASSVTDTTNLTVVEAMALSRPVVVTAVGGLPEVVEDGVTGFVVPPRDPVALAERIERLVRDGDLRDRMGKAARARFLSMFAEHRMNGEYLALFERLLGDSGDERP